MKQPWRLSVEQCIQSLGTHLSEGLAPAEAQRRLTEQRHNELIEHGVKSIWRITWEQLTAIMVVMLIVAAIISAFLGDFKDAIAILAIVVLNTILGVSQEFRAEKAMAALKKMAVPSVKVRRGGHVQEISARDLVRGAIVLLAAGGFVPADARVLESANLRIQEAALTGESEPVEKHSAPLDQEHLPIGDRRNMVYMGTV